MGLETQKIPSDQEVFGFLGKNQGDVWIPFATLSHNLTTGSDTTPIMVQNVSDQRFVFFSLRKTSHSRVGQIAKTVAFRV